MSNKRTITTCKYAGDPSFEACASCNGETFTLDGQVYNCSDCQEYTPVQVPVETSDVTNSTSEKVEMVAEQAEQLDEPQEELPPVETYMPQSVTTTIRAEVGVSCELKVKGLTQWFRYSYCEERTVPATDTVDIEQERAALWNDVNRNVEEQIENALSAYQQS